MARPRTHRSKDLTPTMEEYVKNNLNKKAGVGGGGVEAESVQGPGIEMVSSPEEIRQQRRDDLEKESQEKLHQKTQRSEERARKAAENKAATNEAAARNAAVVGQGSLSEAQRAEQKEKVAAEVQAQQGEQRTAKSSPKNNSKRTKVNLSDTPLGFGGGTWRDNPGKEDEVRPAAVTEVRDEAQAAVSDPTRSAFSSAEGDVSDEAEAAIAQAASTTMDALVQGVDMLHQAANDAAQTVQQNPGKVAEVVAENVVEGAVGAAVAVATGNPIIGMVAASAAGVTMDATESVISRESADVDGVMEDVAASTVTQAASTSAGFAAGMVGGPIVGNVVAAATELAMDASSQIMQAKPVNLAAAPTSSAGSPASSNLEGVGDTLSVLETSSNNSGSNAEDDLGPSSVATSSLSIAETSADTPSEGVLAGGTASVAATSVVDLEPESKAAVNADPMKVMQDATKIDGGRAAVFSEVMRTFSESNTGSNDAERIEDLSDFLNAEKAKELTGNDISFGVFAKTARTILSVDEGDMEEEEKAAALGQLINAFQYLAEESVSKEDEIGKMMSACASVFASDKNLGAVLVGNFKSAFPDAAPVVEIEADGAEPAVVEPATNEFTADADSQESVKEGEVVPNANGAEHSDEDRATSDVDGQESAKEGEVVPNTNGEKPAANEVVPDVRDKKPANKAASGSDPANDLPQKAEEEEKAKAEQQAGAKKKPKGQMSEEDMTNVAIGTTATAASLMLCIMAPPIGIFAAAAVMYLAAGKMTNKESQAENKQTYDNQESQAEELLPASAKSSNSQLPPRRPAVPGSADVTRGAVANATQEFVQNNSAELGVAREDLAVARAASVDGGVRLPADRGNPTAFVDPSDRASGSGKALAAAVSPADAGGIAVNPSVYSAVSGPAELLGAAAAVHEAALALRNHNTVVTDSSVTGNDVKDTRDKANSTERE